MSVAIGFALGLVLGILLSRRPKLSGVVLPVLSVFNTIPGIVFIGLLVLAWGAGTATVLVALGIYATFPVLKTPMPAWYPWTSSTSRLPVAAA